MRKFDTVIVGKVRGLEAGDFICRRVINDYVMTGKVTGVAYSTNTLTEEQKEYCRAENLTLPDNGYEPISPGSALVFGNFVDAYETPGGEFKTEVRGHAFIDWDATVAVWPSNAEGSFEKIRDAATCTECHGTGNKHFLGCSVWPHNRNKV